MENTKLLQNKNYDPCAFLDWLHDVLGCKNDAALSHKLEVAPPVLSKLRHCRIPVGPTVLIKVHDLTDLPIREIRKRMFKGASA